MKYLCWLLLFPAIASAEIYQCKENGKTIFSDSPCGDSAKVIEVKPLEKTGTKLTSDSMEELSDELHGDRRTRELDRAIERQRKKIDNIADTYNEDLTRLQDELADHKAKYDYRKFRNHPSKKKAYIRKKNDYYNRIKEAKRKYKIDRQQAYDKLYSLQRERRRFN